MARAGKRNVLSRTAELLGSFGEFLMESKKWWLGPIVVFLLLLGVILVTAAGSQLAPFIYALF